MICFDFHGGLSHSEENKYMCTHIKDMTVSSKSHQGKEQEEGRSGGVGGKIERKLSKVNTRSVSRGQNEFIGVFKMATGDVISMGVGYEVHIHFNRN